MFLLHKSFDLQDSKFWIDISTKFSGIPTKSSSYLGRLLKEIIRAIEK